MKSRPIIIRTPCLVAQKPTVIVRQRNAVRLAFHRLTEPVRDVIGEVAA